MTRRSDDVERDLRSLTTNSQLKDIEPELSGWGQAIRGIIADGTAAAPLGSRSAGPRPRLRRPAQLGDYARLARLVGAMTCDPIQPTAGLRRASTRSRRLILVLAGEAMAGSGIGGGRFLLAAPASELQARRDAVLLALRNLTGTTQEAYGNNEWPWGLHGLREILRRIERSGHLDLRALLEENVLGRLMDDLIDRARASERAACARSAPRPTWRCSALPAAPHRRRPDRSGSRRPLPRSSKAIQLFLDAVPRSRSGYRLPIIARSPLVFYGLYGIGGPDAPTAGCSTS